MTEVVPVDAQLDLEFAYTPWRESCRDPLLVVHARARGRGFHILECRRADRARRGPRGWVRRAAEAVDVDRGRLLGQPAASPRSPVWRR